VGHQIIRQPDGRLAVFSTGVDAWVRKDSTPADLEDWYAARAAEDSRLSTRRALEDLAEAEARGGDPLFRLTFDEANRESRGHGGEWWQDGRWIS
jgi:hypothetical protein